MPVSYNGQVFPNSQQPENSAYTRPSDWLTMPYLIGGEEKFIGLFPVFDDDSNFLAVYFEGDYSVDWGDGTVESFASGVTAEHTYSFGSIDPLTLTERGYRQVLVTVTPQTGQSLSYIDLSVRHTNIYGFSNSCPWLDISLSMPNAGAGTSIVFYNYSYDFWLGSLEIVSIYDTGGCEDLTSCFRYCTSLRQATIKSMPQVLVIDYLFESCSALTVVNLPDLPPDSYDPLYGTGFVEYVSVGDISNVTSGADEIFYGGYGVGEIVIGKAGTDISSMCSWSWAESLKSLTIIDASTLEIADYAFSSCYSLESVTFSGTPALTSTQYMFQDCYSLQGVQFLDLSGLENADFMFENCYSLRNSYFPPTPSLQSMVGTFTSCYSLEDAIFQDLPSITSLGGAFNFCSGLKKVVLAGILQDVFINGAFDGCKSLETLTLGFPPNSLEFAFDDCKNLQSLDIDDAGYLSVVGGTLSQPSLASLRVPNIEKTLPIQECSLSQDAIVQVFNDLAPIPPGSEWVLVGDNWGTPLLSPGDIQIATDKGWNVGTVKCDFPPFGCNTNVNPYCISNFSQAWFECSGITSFPLIDVSYGTSFNSAWWGCSGLTSFPALDVSSGTDFSLAWIYCTGLTSFPNIDVSSGTDFSLAWSTCTSLTSFPNLDVSSGVFFGSSWSQCSSLTSFPALNCGLGQDFSGAWNNCTSLTSFPGTIDLSSGTDFSSAWSTCTGLTSFPGTLDLSSGTEFAYAWEFCSSLTSFPALDIDGAVFPGSHLRAWRNCTSLTTFPANMFNTCTSNQFFESWRNCALNQTSVNNILVSINAAGTSNGTLGIYGGTSSAPGAAGLAAKSALQARGWTVLTN